MKKLGLLIFVLIIIAGLVIAFLLYRRQQAGNNVINGEIIVSTPKETNIKDLVEKYPLDATTQEGITLSTIDNSFVWIFGKVASLEQDFTTQGGTLVINIRGQEVPVIINQQTRFSRTKAAKSVADSQYTLIRSEEIHIGDSIHVTASFIDKELVVSEVQKRI